MEKAVQKDIELIKDTPAKCASLLLADKVDGGVIPVSAFAYRQDLMLLLNPCVSSNSAVRTVKLYSNKQINEIQEVIVDEDSRISVILLKVILSIKYRKHKLTFFKSDLTNVINVSDDFGYLMIGDKNFNLSIDFKYAYDLATEWVEWVNLPFIFASWMLIDDKDIRRRASLIKKSYIFAKKNMEKLCEEASIIWKLPVEEVRNYFKNNINFEVDLSGIKAIKLFFEMASELKLLPKVKRINFIDA